MKNVFKVWDGEKWIDPMAKTHQAILYLAYASICNTVLGLLAIALAVFR